MLRMIHRVREPRIRSVPTGKGLVTCSASPGSSRSQAPRFGAALLSFALLAGLSGCSSEEAKTDPILLLGLDGLEWRILLPLVQSGALPEFAALMEEGVYGYLTTTRPTLSPIIWTSMATGKTPNEHGIRGFVRRRQGDEGRRLFNSYDRRTKAFWNILSDHGLRVAVIGWWKTHPVEEIDGLMVAQVNTLDQADRGYGRAILKGGMIEGVQDQVFPPERLDELLEVHGRVVEDLQESLRQVFGEFEPELSPLAERLWLNTEWAFRADSTYVEITEAVAGGDYDLVACYLGGTDVVGHRFWRYMEPQLFEDPPLEHEIENLGEIIPDYYRFADAAIGRIRRQMPLGTRVIVVSDHGMRPVRRGERFDAETLTKNINSGGHPNALPGVLIASGSGIDPGPRPSLDSLDLDGLSVVGSIFDVLPAILTLLDIPLARDLAGRPLPQLEATRVAGEAAPTVATYDTNEWLASRKSLEAGELVGIGDQERLEQLRALGYIQ